MRLLLSIFLIIMLGCSEDDPIKEIRKAPASDKESMIRMHIDNFLQSADYEVTGYDANAEYYRPAVELTLKEKNGGREMTIRLQWNTR